VGKFLARVKHAVQVEARHQQSAAEAPRNVMRALQIVKPHKWRIVEIPRPSPGAGEVLICVDYVAMCNQNDYKILYGLYGSLIKYPCDPGVYGHEGVGTVTELGSRVKGLAVGDHVVMMGEGGPMLYMEYVTRKAATVAKVSRKVPLKDAAVLELFGCAHHCMEIVGDVRKKKVGISGLGPAGLAIFQMLKLAKPRAVVGIEPNPLRARTAKKFGLANVLSPTTAADRKKILAEGIDLIIDTAGCPASILAAFEFTRREVVIFGFTNEPFTVDQSKWFQKELVIRNSKVQTIENLRAAVRLLERGKIHTRRLINAVMPYERYAEAVRMLYEHKAVKILLVWRKK
jgi:2-desacetyl-2-hydroxyethyl bacteriochlorophyllide A dehydrogenase